MYLGSVCSTHPLCGPPGGCHCITLEDTQSGQHYPPTFYPLIYSLLAPITLAFMGKPFVGKVREMENIHMTMMEGE
jgi:hypothetical protein